MIEIIQEFLVSLGFDIDKASVSVAEKTIEKTVETVGKTVSQGGKKAEKSVSESAEKAEKSVSKLEKRLGVIAEGLSKNKALQAFISKATGMVNRFVTQFRPKLIAFLADTKVLILGAIGVVTAAVAAIGVAVAGTVSKIMGDAARADIQIQLFARRLFTTVENARSLQAVMNQMGVKDIEGLNDIALNPELRGQFLQLRALASGMALGDEQKEGFKNIRAVGLEFQKLGLIMEYFWQRLGADLGRALAGPLKDIQRVMAGFNNFLKNQMPEITRGIASVVGIAGNLLSIGLKIGGLFTRIPVIGELLNKFLSDFNDKLEFTNALLGVFSRLLDKISGKGASRFGVEVGQDVYKKGQGAFERIAEFTQKIYELLSQIWNFFGSFLRPIKDWVMKKWEELRKNPVTQGFMSAVLGEEASAAMLPSTAGKPISASSPLGYLQAAAKELGLRVTSTTGGRHNKGSLHYTGEAIDVDDRTVTPEKIARLMELGIRVHDERKRPKGQAEWGGSHYHLEFRAAKFAQMLQRRNAIPPANTPYAEGGARKEVEGKVIQQHVSINIPGAGDPKAVAVAVRNELEQMTALSTRNTRGAIV